jgi:uncharacterized repeat protein (TIGR01451 family)
MRRAKHPDGRRRIVVGSMIATILIVTQAGMLTAGAVPPADIPGSPSADGVQPTIVDSQASSNDCGELGFDHGISIAGNGRASSGALTVTVTGYNSPIGFADWASNLPIHGVYAKSGPSGGNLFSYPAGDTGDQDLHTPQKATGDHGLSHLAFCWNEVATETASDVTIAKANDPDGAVLNGATITYTLTASNHGDATATVVQVTDQLPSGVTFVSGDAGCSAAGGLVTCTVGEIGAGASLDVDITVTVEQTFCGSIVNTAAVSASNESAEVTGNNSSNQVTNTVGCDEPTPPDLQVSKTSDADGILHEGDDFFYTITVTNVGDEEATGVELLDVLPARAVNVGVPIPTFAGAPCIPTSSISPDGVPHAEVRCGPATLDPGESVEIKIRVIVSGDVCGTITNGVDVEGTNELGTSVGEDNHAQVSDEIACTPRIRLLKGGPSLAHVGDTITYIFNARNNGGVDLTNIKLSDPNCDSAPMLVDDADGDPTLGVGERWGFECDHSVTAGDGNVVHNEATLTGDHEGGTVKDKDTHDVDVIHPSVDLEKTATPTAGAAGTVIVYTYTVQNTGDTPLFHVSVDDDKLGHVRDIATLAAGATAVLSAEVALGSSPITNIATAEGEDRLGRSVDDEDTATVTVVAGEGGSDDDHGTGGSAFTGSDAGILAGWMVALAALGSALLVTSRRRSQPQR